MKLYYSPGACSLAAHVLLQQVKEKTGRAFDAERVDLAGGAQYQAQFLKLNPKSKVPTLERDDGSILTESPAIAWWIASSAPGAGLMPDSADGVARSLETLNFVSGTVHNGGYTRIFRAERFVGDPSHADAAKQKATADTKGFLEKLDASLGGRDFVAGGTFGFADPLVYVMARWTGRAGFELAGLPNLKAHHDRVAAMPATKAALATEGLS